MAPGPRGITKPAEPIREARGPERNRRSQAFDRRTEQNKPGVRYSWERRRSAPTAQRDSSRDFEPLREDRQDYGEGRPSGSYRAPHPDSYKYRRGYDPLLPYHEGRRTYPLELRDQRFRNPSRFERSEPARKWEASVQFQENLRFRGIQDRVNRFFERITRRNEIERRTFSENRFLSILSRLIRFFSERIVDRISLRGLREGLRSFIKFIEIRVKKTEVQKAGEALEQKRALKEETAEKSGGKTKENEKSGKKSLKEKEEKLLGEKKEKDRKKPIPLETKTAALAIEEKTEAKTGIEPKKPEEKTISRVAGKTLTASLAEAVMVLGQLLDSIPRADQNIPTEAKDLVLKLTIEIFLTSAVKGTGMSIPSYEAQPEAQNLRTILLGATYLAAATSKEWDTLSLEGQIQLAAQVFSSVQKQPAEQKVQFLNSLYTLGKLSQELPSELITFLVTYIASQPPENRIEALNTAVQTLENPQNIAYFCQALNVLSADLLISIASEIPPPAAGNKVISFSAAKASRSAAAFEAAPQQTAQSSNPIKAVLDMGKQTAAIEQAIVERNAEAVAKAIQTFVQIEYVFPLLPAEAATAIVSSALARIILAKGGVESVVVLIDAYEVVRANPTFSAAFQSIEYILIESLLQIILSVEVRPVIFKLLEVQAAVPSVRKIIVRVFALAIEKERASREIIEVLVDLLVSKALAPAPSHPLLSILEDPGAEAILQSEAALFYLLEMLTNLNQPEQKERTKLERAAIVERLISQFLSDPENPELIQALLNFIQTEIAAAREIAPQIRALIFNYLVQAMQMLAEEISLEQTIASPKLHLVSAESPMISAAPEGIAAEHQAALLAAAGHLLKVVSQENTSREEFQKAYRAFLETAAAANLKISLENYIRGYIYAGILLSANGAAKSDLIAEMDTVSAQSRSSTNPRVVADINKGETGADIARGDFEAVSDSSHESAFFICGVVHRLLESQKAKAERIIGVLHNNPLVWEKMLDHVENQRIERVIDFVNNLLYTARSMVAPTAGENPHQAGYVYSKPVLEAALAKVAGGANPQAAALAA